MAENKLYLVKEYNFDNPNIKNIDSIINNSIRDCRNKYFHTFDHECVYDLNFTNINNKKTLNFTTSEKNFMTYELNKKINKSLKRGFKFNHINKLTIKIYSNLSHINIHHRLMIGSPRLFYHFFRKIAHNPEYIQTFCNDHRNPFHFACRQWYSYNIQ